MGQEVVPLASNEGIRRLFSGGKNSVVCQTLMTVVVEPAVGFYESSRAKGSKGKHYSEVYGYFSRKEQTPDASNLGELVNKITGEETGVGEHILGHRGFARWQEIKNEQEQILGGCLSNYVVKDGDQIQVVPGSIKENGPRQEVIGQRIQVELDVEHKYEHGEAVRMSPGANQIDCLRHEVYSRNGQWISGIRDQGGESCGESQQCLLRLTNGGLGWDGNRGKLRYDQELFDQVVDTRLLSRFGLLPVGGGQRQEVEQELEKYLTGVAKYKLAKKVLRSDPEARKAVREFLQSQAYLDLEKDFRDCHLSAHGLTETRVAEEIVANWLLPEEFQTCWQVTGWDKAKQDFLGKNRAWLTDTGLMGDQVDLGQLWEKGGGISELSTSLEQKAEVITKAEESRDRLRGEMQRYADGKPVWNWINQFLGGPFLDNDKKTMKPWTQFVSWLVFTKFKELNQENYSIALWFPEGDYYPTEKPVEPAEGKPADKVEDSLKFIFNGQGGARDQEARILREEAGILEHIKSMGGRVGEFAARLDNPNLAEDILGEMSSTYDYDPSGTNIYYLGNFEGFRGHLKKRLVRDLVYGFQKEVWRETQIGGAVKAAVKPSLEVSDFSDLEAQTMANCLTKIEGYAQHRTEEFMGDKKASIQTLRDFKEEVEIHTLWRGNGTKFLRHKRNFPWWTIQGLGFECLCDAQQLLFDAQSLRVN